MYTKGLLLIQALLCLITAHAQNFSRFDHNKLREAAAEIVLINNDNGFIPVKNPEQKKFAAIHIGTADLASSASFDSIINKYSSVASVSIAVHAADSIWYRLHDDLRFSTALFVVLHPGSVIGEREMKYLSMLATGRDIAIVSLATDNWQQLQSMTGLQSAPFVLSGSWSPEAASIAAQLLFGGIAADNKFKPVAAKTSKKIKTYKVEKIRLGYGVPESAGMPSDFLASVDSIVNAGIATHATPGAVVLLVKDGQVIFDKAYGYHTYTGDVQTKTTDLFDMASVTKVTATTPVIMQLYDKKLLSLDSPVSSYVNALKAVPDKKDQTVKEALLHEAGYTPYIKFYEKLTPLDLSYHRSDSFPTEIAENYFLRKNYFRDVMWPVTLQSPVLTRGKFVYSDVSMYMMKQVAENVSHRELDEFVWNEIYQPLGMHSSGYRPLLRFPKSRMVPTTENDNWLRNMQVTGFVNDPGAAMSGGVQGHAGLFSTSNDLAIYYQMLLNKGSYGSRKFFEPATVSLFTSRQSKVSTRGLGFQKPTDSIAPAAGYPSLESYGHSGYTGTYVWVDPTYNMIYICLTNRVYPDDGKTYGPPKVNIRPMVLDTYYRAILAARRK